MPTWFTLTPLDPQTIAISEPLHWEHPHSYLLLGQSRAALIDSGLGVSNIRAVVDGLTNLPLTLLTTHVHWDHIGGHRHFPHIAVHEAEAAWLNGNFPLPLEAVKRNLTAHPCNFPPEFDLEDYRVFQGPPRQILRDGDRVDLGGRTLQVFHTPGHSPGHCCFYEAARGYLFSGDLLYRGCLDAFYPSTDPKLFHQSVQRLREFSVRRILPGHHSLDVPTSLIAEVEAAFAELEHKGLLRHGSGIFDFGNFQLHL